MKRITRMLTVSLIGIWAVIYFNTGLFIHSGEYATFDGSGSCFNKYFSKTFNNINITIRIVLVIIELVLLYNLQYGILIGIMFYIMRPIIYMFLMDSNINVYISFPYEHISISYAI